MQRPTGRFFLLTFVLTFTLQLPAALAQLGVLPGPVTRYLGPMALGALGPMIAAILSARREKNSGGVRALFAQLGNWRVGAQWYFAALLGIPLLYAAAHALCLALGVPHSGQWWYPPENSEHVAALAIMPFVEEIGWRGFALPRLQDHYGRLRASLMLGAAWAAWHTLMFIIQQIPPAMFLAGMVNIVSGSVIFSWIYNRANKSLLLAWLAHVGVHINNPTHALPANPTPFVAYTLATTLGAVAVVLLDRPAWRNSDRSTAVPR